MDQHTIPTPYMVGDVHIYSTEINDQLILFDTGPDTPEARSYLESHLDLDQLRHVFITHCHVDHYGLAWYLAEKTSARIYLPRIDIKKLQNRDLRHQGLKEQLLACGFDPSYVEGFRATLKQNQIYPPLPEIMQVAEEADCLESLGLSVMSCGGHSQSDLIYYNERWAVTGDVLLRGIFQAPLLDIDLETFSGRYRNYEAYCETLIKLGRLRGLTIWPSHREYIDSLEETILFYATKLLERAARIREFPVEWSVAQVVEKLPGRVDDPFIAYLKASEVIFIRDFLANPELLAESLTRLGLREQLDHLFPMNLAS